MDNQDLQIIKKQILKYLTEDFRGNQAIFDSKEGYQCFNGTDLTMVMDKVVDGLKSSQGIINKSGLRKGVNAI